jgi:hypothetical protein
MTRHGTVLPIPDDPRIASLQAAWPPPWPEPWPRSVWLSAMEQILRQDLPGHSSRDYNLTARSLAPFPLADKDWL